MANWDFVFPYDERAETWLTQHNYVHPLVLPGNRPPTTADIKSALNEQGNLILDYPNGDDDFYVFERGQEGFTICIRGFNWNDDNATPKESSFAIRWMGELQSTVLAALSRRCGQLSMWPDSGAPAIIFQAGDHPKVINALWNEANQGDKDSWAYFFEQMYSEAQC